MLHPNQFQVNEAWIAFKLNDIPVRTESEGDFDIIALMDAASCFILGSEFVLAGSPELSQMAAKRLLKVGQSYKQQLPKTLVIPTDQPANLLSVEATRHGIDVVRVSGDELLVFIGEAREGFKEHFGRSGAQ